MEEVLFGLEPGGPYAHPTAGGNATIDLWCNEDRDVLIIRNDDEGAALAALAETIRIRERLTHPRYAMVVTETCLRDETQTVEPTILEHSCLLVPPLRYSSGKKYCRVWALDPDQLTALYHDLRSTWNVSIESKRSISRFDYPLRRFEMEEPSLSRRQDEAIRTAVDLGYYEIPRQATTSDLASEMDIERRTAETHLRLAEQKIVEAIVETL